MKPSAVRALLRRAAVRPETLPGLDGTEWDALLRLLRQGRLLARTATALEDHGVWHELPPRPRNVLRAAQNQVMHQQRLLAWNTDRFAWGLGSLDVPLIALKGAAYQLAGLPLARRRPSSDVDILVPAEHLAAVESQLLARGWYQKELSPYDDAYYRRWTHELPPMRHREWEMELDLHHTILPVTARAKPDPRLLWAESVAIPGSRLRMLSPRDMTLHAVAHLFHDGHLANDLRQLIDIRELLAHWSAAVPAFWDGFWQRAQALDLARPTWYALRYVHTLLDAEVPAAVLARASEAAPPPAVRFLMDRIVPLALFPEHPDHPTRRAAVSRLLLYMRSHWLRMPPLLLGRHLAYKYYLRHSPPQVAR